MKTKLFLILNIFILLNPISIEAQVLYGTTQEGGEYGIGAIVKYNIESNTLPDTPEHSFSTPYPGANSEAKLAEFNNLFYGVTRSGGVNGDGTLFSYNPATGIYQKLFGFNRSTTGRFPSAALTLHNDILYGTTRFGGLNNDGTLFSYNPATNTHQKLQDFNSINGWSHNGFVLYDIILLCHYKIRFIIYYYLSQK